MSLNIHLYASPMTHESRILRMSRVAAGLGLFSGIEIVGYKEGDLAYSESLDSSRTVVRLPSWHRIPKLRGVAVLRYFLWYIMVVLRYLRKDIAVIHSNGVEDLFPAVVLKMFHPTAKLIYDAHELESERNGWSGINKRIAAAVERLFIRHADAVFVVSGMIGKWYRDSYKLNNVKVVRNIPEQSMIDRNSVESIREKIGATATDTVFLYQGAFFEGRGLEALVTAFAEAPEVCKLVFIGYGRLEPRLKALSRGVPNVFLLPATHPEEILAFTEQADVGLCLIEDTSLS